MTTAVTYVNFCGMLIGEVRAGVTTDYLPDTLGSCIGTVDSTGAVSSTADFYPFGEVASSTGANPSPWGFCGLLGYFQDLLSRLYVRARHLNTALARWLTVDLLWPRQRGYVYCDCRPVSARDRSGLGTFSVGVEAFGATEGLGLGGFAGIEVLVDTSNWHIGIGAPVGGIGSLGTGGGTIGLGIGYTKESLETSWGNWEGLVGLEGVDELGLGPRVSVGKGGVLGGSASIKGYVGEYVGVYGGVQREPTVDISQAIIDALKVTQKQAQNLYDSLIDILNQANDPRTYGSLFNPPR